MRKHKAIELIDLFKKRYGDKKYVNEVLAFHEDLKNLLQKSVGFCLVDMSDNLGTLMNSLAGERVFSGKNAIDISAPYDIVWVEYKVLIQETNKVEDMGTLAVFSNRCWYVYPFFGDIMQLCQLFGVIDLAGGPDLEIRKTYGDMSDTSEGNVFLVRQHISMLNLFLMLINSKNITTEVVKAPAKLNKRRQKKGRSAVHDYHVLNVEIPKRSKKYINSMETGVKQRVHLCRGHFKTFTEDAPLFGKVTGRFWWQPLVRGDKTRGLLNKDYKVLAKNT